MEMNQICCRLCQSNDWCGELPLAIKIEIILMAFGSFISAGGEHFEDMEQTTVFFTRLVEYGLGVLGQGQVTIIPNSKRFAT